MGFKKILESYIYTAKFTIALLVGFFCLIYYPMKLESFVALMVVQTNPKPLWGPIQSWKVGATNGLDGTASTGNTGYTWSCTAWDNGDGGGSRSCSFLMFSSTSASQPTVTGAVFGDYTIHLCDGAGMNCVDAHVGAVDYDSNGVVQNTATINALFGIAGYQSMIALGQNPWGEEDERELAGLTYQTNYLNSLQVNPPLFTTSAAGTITYKLWGNTHATTLSGNSGGVCSSSATSCTVANAALLNLTSFPTLVVINDVGSNGPTGQYGELVWVCSLSTNTLNFCYDGRGAARGSWSYIGSTLQVAAANHSDGEFVGNAITTGTSTLFATDSSRPVCPAGVPGLPGPVIFSSGTVVLTPSSTALTGTGVLWNSAGVNNLRVSATHASGTPFVFMSVVTPTFSTLSGTITNSQTTLNVGSGASFPSAPFLIVIDSEQMTVTNKGSGANWTVTRAVNGSSAATHDNGSNVFDPIHQTMSRPAPSDVDGTGFSYKITGEQYYVPQAVIPGSSPTALTNVGTDIQACASETQLSSQIAGGFGAMAFTTMTSVKYSTMLTRGAGGFANYNLYANGMFYRGLWLRSGLVAAKTVADNIDEYWVNQPEVAAGYGYSGDGGIRVMGIVGTIIDKVSNPNTSLTWDHIRQFGEIAKVLFTSGDCNAGDARTNGIANTILSQLANWDTAQQSHWNGYLYSNADSVYAWATGTSNCKRSDYSFSNTGGSFNPTNTLTMTFNSKNVTATSGTFDVSTGGGANACYGVAVGTATVTNGSDVIHRLTGTFPTNPATPPITYQISLVGTKSGSVYTVNPDYKNIDADNLYNAGIWDGDTGTIDWMAYYSGPSGLTTTFALDGNDVPAINENFQCMYLTSTTAVLNRVWDINDGNNTSRHMSSYVYTGRLQSPFLMGGSFDQALSYATQNANSTIATAFTGLFGGATTWLHDSGIDLIGLTTHYCRGPVGGDCEPVGIVPSSNYDGRYTAGNSSVGTEVPGVVASRQENVEIALPLTNYFLSQDCSAAAKTYVDRLYGAIWGSSTYNTGGVYQDSSSGGNNIAFTNYTNASLGSFRWSGFNFGMGRSALWPAMRNLPVGCGANTHSPTNLGGKIKLGGKITAN